MKLNKSIKICIGTSQKQLYTKHFKNISQDRKKLLNYKRNKPKHFLKAKAQFLTYPEAVTEGILPSGTELAHFISCSIKGHCSKLAGRKLSSDNYEIRNKAVDGGRSGLVGK